MTDRTPGTPETITGRPDEIAALKRSCRILANITARNHQVMEAARIEMGQNGPHAAMQWILNNLPDVWDDDETAWDGKESAEEWFDRTESFYRAAQDDATPIAAESPAPASPEPDTAAMGAAEGDWRERAVAAEGKLAKIAAHCQRRLDMAIVQSSVSHLCWDIQAIIGGEEESRG